jgi:type II secretory pathway predicted ATPase ExeA
MSSPIGSHPDQWASGEPVASCDSSGGRKEEPIEPSDSGSSQGAEAAAPSGSQVNQPPEVDPPSAPERDADLNGDGQSPAAESDLESYETFFGMREPPFTLTPNPAFFFVNDRGREGLKQIEYGIRRREGFAVISGDVGTGKTTLCWALLERLEKMNVCTALVQNPMVSATDVLKLILHDLGVRPKTVEGDQADAAHLFDTSWMAGMGQMELIERLNTFLIQMARKGLFTVVIIDEAQRLSMETLEQLRLLSNLETANQKLLQIIFVGQVELEQMLEKPELRQLNQRISVRFQTKPLDKKESADYIRHRLRIAWAIPRLQFKKRAFDTIYRLSGGYPRLINMICDRALSFAFRQESYVVTAKTVRRSFRSIKELAPSRTSVWLRRLIPFAAALALALLILLLLLAIKSVIPSTGSASSPAPASAVSPVRPPADAGSVSDERPPAAAAKPAPARELPAPERPKPAPAARAGAASDRREYILQTSSFRESGNATAASEEIKARGIPSFLDHYGSGPDGGWYRVYAGPFSELSDAMQAASALETALGVRPLLRQRPAR